MDITNFYALQTGTAPDDEGSPLQLGVHGLGMLRVPSGNLGACDPFVSLDQPTVVRIPPGNYPVYATIADVSDAQDGSHLREAYLSLVLSEATSTQLEPAPGPNGPPDPGEFFGVGVDAGSVAFVDADAVARSMPGHHLDWHETVFENATGFTPWFDVMDAQTPLNRGLANIVMPLATAGENVVLSHSGWGDGFYPLVQTKDAAGNVTAIHIDLGIVGLEGDDEPSSQPGDAPAPAEAVAGSSAAQQPRQKGLFARLFGR